MSFEKKPITEIVDFNPKRAIKKGSVAPFIDMAALPVSSRDVDEITEKEFKSGGAKFCNGDTLFARITPCLENGKTAKVSGLDKNQNGFGSTEFIVMSAKDQEHDEDYVYYLARLPEFRAYAKARMEGTSGRQRVPWQSLAEFEYPLPSKEQRKLAGNFFRAIDDKISLNTQTNQTLEQMAQAIFKSWFVDFDPVKAKINGEQPEGMDAATASLFPEKLVESELGLIPEGWSVEEAKSQLDVLRGFSYKGKGLVGSLDEGVPMHNLNSVFEGGGYKYAGLKFYSEEFKEKFAIQEGDVLVANTEQGHNHLLIGYGAMVPKHLAHGFFSHHTYRVRPKKNSNMTPEFIERLFGKGRFVRQVQGFTNGTTVNMLPVAGMEMPQFVVPSKALAQKFSELVKPMKAMIEENHKSNIELAKLRDTLLPKLLSGEIELGETEEMAEVN